MCFLFNGSTKTFLGPFRAADRVANNLEPSAWARHGQMTPFPLQLRVRADPGGVFSIAERDIAELLHYERARNLTASPEISPHLPRARRISRDLTAISRHRHLLAFALP